MQLERQTCLRALRSHDTRFDGVFFVGVSSTGIYCRPVCPAKPPKAENCTFFPAAAAAEKAGFRPCLRCRPELAPGNAAVDSSQALAASAAARIEDGALSELTVGELAAELGVTDRHLRRVTLAEFGVTPIELAQTRRLLTAKHLLTDTRVSITEVAFASGFASLRRFNALFRERYRLSPTALRRNGRARTVMDSVGCRIAFRPPLDWDSLLTFLQARAAEGVESVESGRYARTAGIGKHAGWISVEPIPGAPALRIEMSTSLAPAFAGIVARVKRLFDLSANPLAIAEHLGGIADMNPGLRVPGAFDGFEVAVRAVLGQQVSVKGATTLARRFANVFGEAIETPIAGLARLTPTAARIASASVAELAAIGLPRTRASSIQALAAAIAGEHISLDRAAPAETTILRLRAIPGIGEWTAQYIAMRCLGWPDAFPHTDLGIKKALGTMDPSRAIEIAEKWRPWRAYATMHLWNSLSNSRNANFAEELGEESNR